ncbi:MAG: PEP/pyruvate-binding domain-containing protein [Candidatus Aquicultorales bacterium]
MAEKLKSPFGVVEADRLAQGQRVVGLEDLNDSFRETVGAKAMNLARMVRMGLSVPAGFCISSEAYSDHVRKLGVESLMERLADSSPDDIPVLLSDLRRAISRAPLDPALWREISDRYRGLRSTEVAVRSSANVEDLAGHSFAGQHGTYFVSELPAVLRAIKDCWASLWTERAFDYRAQRGFSHEQVAMGVIVQRLVQAEAAGVLFTSDPVGGRSDRIVIEACFGLGEALVSGTVTPDRITLSKNDLRIVDRFVAKKPVKLVLGGKGCAEVVQLSSESAGCPSIDDRTAHRLSEMALVAERGLGRPLDIEWALDSRGIHLLQARPITTPVKEASFEDRQVWSNANAGEVLPDVATPATWSLIETIIHPIFRGIFGKVGIDIGDNPVIGQVAGRAYFNLNTMTAALRKFPGWKRMDINRVLGGMQAESADNPALRIPDDDLPDVKFSPLKLAARFPSFLPWFIAHSPKRGLGFVDKIRTTNDRLATIDVTSLSDNILLEHLRTRTGDPWEIGETLVFSMMGMFGFELLDKACKRWLGEDNAANRLLSGVGELDSARAGTAIWELAEMAKGIPEVERLLLSGDEYPHLVPLLRLANGGKDFLDSLDKFMAEHGHHARGEIELYNERWSERPDYILDTVRSYLNAMTDGGRVAERARPAERSASFAGECRRRLGSPIKRLLFDLYLNQARRGLIVRENGKSEAIRHIAFLRSLLLEIGRRLVSAGVLTAPNDIFFLRLDEVKPVFVDRPNFDAWAIIRSRRAEYEKNLAIVPPPIVIGRFDPSGFHEVDAPASGRVLKGIPVSTGKATGTARVILRSDDKDKVLPGEILVAPFTDPGWTPYFIPAAAIVMDMGGLLSHGSIIAREYAIPAVVNVGNATKTIRTGDTVEVDGDTGTVMILEEPPITL